MISPLAAARVRPRRSRAVHALAILLALASLGLLAGWLVAPASATGREAPLAWRAWDVALCAAFALEFFTRSGFRWRPAGYVASHLFDFVAIVPALALVGHTGGRDAWLLWIVFAARAIRVVDRALRDGFVQRLALLLLEGLEEEIADRVTLRVLERMQRDLASAGFGKAVGESLAKSKAALLERIHEETTQAAGAAAGIAHAVGLDAAISRAEARAFDAIVNVVASEEVDAAIRAGIDSTFASLRTQVARKEWRERVGELRRG